MATPVGILLRVGRRAARSASTCIPGRRLSTNAWPAVTVGEVGAPEDAVFVDLDGDGTLDVVSSCEGQQRTVFVHWSPTNPEELLDRQGWITDAFPRLRGQQLWMYACPFPAVRHGGSDLVLGSKGADAGIWLLGSDQPTRDLRRWREQRLRSAGWIMSLVASDLDNDHDLDLVLSDRKGARRGAYWLQNPGRDAIRRGTAWPEHPIGAAGKEAMFLTVADVDGDGSEDVVIMTLEGHLEYCRRTKTGVPDWQRTVIRLPEGHVRGKGIGVGDIDGDQRSDLVITTEDGCVAWRRSVPDPFSTDGEWFDIGGSVGYKFDRLELWDLDEDGDLDLLTCEERDNLGVVWYENLSQ